MSNDDPSSSNVLSKPEHVLTFIKHALQGDTGQDTAFKQASVNPSSRQGLTMNDLRIVPEKDADEDTDTEGDSDDETSSLQGAQGAQPNDEMTITALNLLLSILEGGIFCLLQALLNISLTVAISKSYLIFAVGFSSRRNF